MESAVSGSEMCPRSEDWRGPRTCRAAGQRSGCWTGSAQSDCRDLGMEVSNNLREVPQYSLILEVLVGTFNKEKVVKDR